MGSNTFNLTQNTTFGNECPSEGKAEPITAIVIKGAAYLIILSIALMGNSSIIAIVVRNKRMRTSTNRFICNMATADLLQSVFRLPINFIPAVKHVATSTWLVGGTFGLAMCKLLPFINDVSLAVSIQSCVLIAFDRFYAVVYPYNRPLITSKVATISIAFTWITAAGINAPIFYTARLGVYNGRRECYMTWEPAFDNFESQRKYFIVSFIMFYALPLLAILVLYVCIIKELKKTQSANIERNSLEGQIRNKENNRVLGMLVTVVLIFAIGWAPFQTFGFLGLFYPSSLESLTCATDFIFAMVFVANAGCALNPCVYFIFIEKYRHALKAMLSSCLHCDGCKRSRSSGIKVNRVPRSQPTECQRSSLFPQQRHKTSDYEIDAGNSDIPSGLLTETPL